MNNLATVLPLIVASLSIIGNIILSIFNFRYKRVEIRDSVFQQKRLSAIEDFFSCMARVEKMWDQLPFEYAPYDINERILLEENLRKFLNELRQKLLAVTIYVSNDEKDLFDEVYSHMMDIEDYVLSALKKKRDPSSKSYEEYIQFKKTALNQAFELLQAISSNVRKSYRNK